MSWYRLNQFLCACWLRRSIGGLTWPPGSAPGSAPPHALSYLASHQQNKRGTRGPLAVLFKPHNVLVVSGNHREGPHGHDGGHGPLPATTGRYCLCREGGPKRQLQRRRAPFFLFLFHTLSITLNCFFFALFQEAMEEGPMATMVATGLNHREILMALEGRNGKKITKVRILTSFPWA